MTRYDVALLALAYAGFGNWWFCRMRAKVDSVYGPDSLAGAPVVKFLAHVAVMFAWPALFLVHAKMVANKRAKFERDRYRARVHIRRSDVDAVLEEAVRRIDDEDVAAILRGEQTFADAIGEAIPKAITATDLAKARDYVRRNADGIYDRWNRAGRSYQVMAEIAGAAVAGMPPPPFFLTMDEAKEKLAPDIYAEIKRQCTPGHPVEMPGRGMGSHFERWQATNPPGVGASLAEMEAHHGSAPDPRAFDADHDNGEFPKPPAMVNIERDCPKHPADPDFTPRCPHCNEWPDLCRCPGR